MSNRARCNILVEILYILDQNETFSMPMDVHASQKIDALSPDEVESSFSARHVPSANLPTPPVRQRA